MRRRLQQQLSLVLVVCFILGGCGRSGPGVATSPQANLADLRENQTRAVGVALSDQSLPEIEPLVAFLKSQYATEIKSGKLLVISDSMKSSLDRLESSPSPASA